MPNFYVKYYQNDRLRSGTLVTAETFESALSKAQHAMLCKQTPSLEGPAYTGEELLTEEYVIRVARDGQL